MVPQTAYGTERKPTRAADSSSQGQIGAPFTAAATPER